MVEHPVSRWSDLFEQACRIIEQANSEPTMIDSWTFGGGTALMLQIDHRALLLSSCHYEPSSRASATQSDHRGPKLSKLGPGRAR
ncbi:hypothetical protein CN130_34980 [Sinorhizobium meliloti]|nr:hypothetical protein CN130_34980 [Sinorhizobium meliloti]